MVKRGTRIKHGVRGLTFSKVASSGTTFYPTAYSSSSYQFACGLIDIASSGVSHGTGATSNILEVNTGLNFVTGLFLEVYDTRANAEALASSTILSWRRNATTASKVTIASFARRYQGPPTTFAAFRSGASCSWLAFGY